MDVFKGEEKEDKIIRRISDSSRTLLHPLTKIPQKIVNINKYSMEFRNIPLTENNAEKIFKSFLRENISFLSVDTEVLELSSLKKIRDKWYIKFQQRYKGLPVNKATLGLDATNEGKIGSYSSNYHPEIDAPTEPRVSLQNAVKTAINTYEDVDQNKLHHKNDEIIIYPRKEDEKITYLLARKFIITTDDQNVFLEKYFIVDAIDGKILESYPTRIIGAKKIYGQVRGQIYPENPGDAVVTEDMEDEYVSIEYLDIVTTDGTGRYEKTVPWYWPLIEWFFNPDCTFELNGPYARVQNRNGNDYRVDRRCRTNTSCDHTWTDADRDHINVFYHMNLFHDWLKNQLNYNWWNSWTNSHRFNARVNILEPDGTVWNNASAGDPMSFGNNPFARSSDIVYHECSHNVLFDLYNDWIGFSNGFFNEGYAFDEGFADYFACACTNDSRHGEGAGGARDLVNNRQYAGKDAYNLEGHTGGQIIGGAAWDIRQAMINLLGQNGAKDADQLIFDALQILATYPSDYFFSDPHESNFLSAIYYTDDDNNNIVDGIPHFKIIHDAFRRHNLLQAILYPMDSFDFSCNLVGELSGGDLYYNNGKFFANNLHQRGVKDLGDIGNVDLEDVIITSGGYTRFGVDAVVGHTYVSLAHEGEEGNHIVFRVNSLAADQSEFTIEYCYRFQLFFWVDPVYDLKKYLWEAARAELVYERLTLIGRGEDILGLLDVTDQKDKPVNKIVVPSVGLSLEVQATEGHMYIVVTKRKERNIIFRVDNIDRSRIRLEILIR